MQRQDPPELRGAGMAVGGSQCLSSITGLWQRRMAMVQYEITLPNEYTEDMISDVAKILHMDFVKKDMKNAIDERDKEVPIMYIF